MTTYVKTRWGNPEELFVMSQDAESLVRHDTDGHYLYVEIDRGIARLYGHRGTASKWHFATVDAETESEAWVKFAEQCIENPCNDNDVYNNLEDVRAWLSDAIESGDDDEAEFARSIIEFAENYQGVTQ